jgi:hypothetical protein
LKIVDYLKESMTRPAIHAGELLAEELGQIPVTQTEIAPVARAAKPQHAIVQGYFDDDPADFPSVLSMAID